AWPRAQKAITAPARRTRPSRPSHRRGAPVTTPSAAETVPCPGGGAAIRPALAAWLGHVAPARQGPDQGADEAVEADAGRKRSWFSLAGGGGGDVDAGGAFGQGDHAAAGGQDVLGLVGELGRDGGAALGGVGGDVVPGDVRVVGVGDVVDLQAGVEVGEVDQTVVGGQAGQALLLVLVVRAGSAALGAKARGVVTGRWPGRGEHGHQDRVGLVGDVDGRDVAGGVAAVFPERFAVDDHDVAARQRHRRVHGGGGAQRRGSRGRGGRGGGGVVGGVGGGPVARGHPAGG